MTFDLASSVPGIDLSHWDDARGSRLIDYPLMAREVSWAIVRVGDGGRTDQSFARNVEGLTGAVPLGTYLFCRPGRNPERQAREWAEAVAEHSDPFVLGHWADLEDNDGLDRAQVAAWIDTFLTAADAALGRRVNIYTGASWWNGHVDPGFVPSAPERRSWWVARYPWPGVTVADPATWPSWVAAHYTEAREPVAPFDAPEVIWQWSSEGDGPTVGTYRAGHLDCNLMDAAVFAALTGEVQDAQPAPPAPVPPHGDDEEDEVHIVRREAEDGEEQDPRLYKTNGLWKERIQGSEGVTPQEAWDLACDDLGFARGTFEDWDAGRINRMATIGTDPAE